MQLKCSENGIKSGVKLNGMNGFGSVDGKELINERIDGCTDDWMNGWNKKMDEWIYESMYGWMNYMYGSST